mgnify:CR=1 FL=1
MSLGAIAAFDFRTLTWLAAHRSPFGIELFNAITDFGGAAILTVAMIGAYYILWRGKQWPYAVGLIVSLGGAALFANFLKLLIARERPAIAYRAITEFGASFPSIHAACSAALYGFLAYAAWKLAPKPWRLRIPMLCVFFIALIGFSRMYLGVHYMSDVAAGFAIGFGFVLIGAHVTRTLARI